MKNTLQNTRRTPKHNAWHMPRFCNLVMYFLTNLLWSCWKVKTRSIFLFCFLLTYFYAHDFIPVAPIDLITSPIDCSLESWFYSCFPVFLRSCTSEPSFPVIPNWSWSVEWLMATWDSKLCNVFYPFFSIPLLVLHLIFWDNLSSL